MVQLFLLRRCLRVCVGAAVGIGIGHGLALKALWYGTEPVIASKIGLFVVYPLVVVATAMLGHYCAERPWRRGAYIIGTYTLLEIAVPTGDRNQLPIGLVVQAALAVPCILASYLGAHISRKRLPLTAVTSENYSRRTNFDPAHPTS